MVYAVFCVYIFWKYSFKFGVKKVDNGIRVC